MNNTFISPIIKPKQARSFFENVLSIMDSENLDNELTSVIITDIFKNSISDINISGKYFDPKSSETRSLVEIAVLAFLVKSIKPTTVFEIGTFIGRTTMIFYQNTGRNCSIFTIDLPQDKVSHCVGNDFCDNQEALERITQLSGDSTKFDFSPWFGKCDFVWVDACHDYEFVKADTTIALKLCKKDGWIAWHDYRHTAWWSGVTKSVRELNKLKKNNIMHIRGTTIALMQNS